MLNLKNYQRTFLYTLLHFAVDGICSAIIFSYLYSEQYWNTLVVFILYNSLAFLGQPLVGFLIDKYNQPRLFLLVSILALSLGFLVKFQSMLSAIFLGIGNAVFHICGGKDITIHTNNEIISLGVFVSTGVIGLMLGQSFFSLLLLNFLYAILFICSLVFFLSAEEKPCLKQKSMSISRKNSFLFLLILSGAVAIRSFVGKIPILEFSVTNGILALISLSTCLGKMVGGVLAKWIGIGKTIFCSVMVSILCLVFGNANPYTLCLGIFCFNFSMPITLYYAHYFSKGKEGFAFGLLAAFLFIGYILGMPKYSPMTSKALTLILSILSAIAILFITNKRRGMTMLNFLFYPLIITLGIEELILVLLKEKRIKVHILAFFMNCCTNISINLIAYALHFESLVLYMVYVIIAEAMVWFLEGMGYFILLRDASKAVKYTLLCNSISLTVGFFIQGISQIWR